MHCQISYMEILGKKSQIFLQPFNLLKCIVVGLLMRDGGGGGGYLACYFTESGINQYVGQETLTDVFGASLLLLERSCFRNIVLPYHLRMLLYVFISNQ